MYGCTYVHFGVNVFLLLTEDYAEVYKCQFELAQYFESTEDKWLSDHFYRSCLATSVNVSEDNGKTMAQAHCMLGIAQEANGERSDVQNIQKLYLNG